MARLAAARTALSVLAGVVVVLSGGCPRSRDSEQLVLPPGADSADLKQAAPEGEPQRLGCVCYTPGKLAWANAEDPTDLRTIDEVPADWGPPLVSLPPDHRSVAYVTSDLALKVAHLGVSPLQVGKAFGADAPLEVRGQMAWAPDSSRLAYLEKENTHIASLDGKTVQLTEEGGIGDVSWSPDGKRLAYCRRADDSKDLGLWLISADGGEPTCLVRSTGDIFGASFPFWSPDSRTIAFCHAWEGGALGFVNADGSGRHTNLGPAWTPLLWAPDNSAVIYMADVSEGGPEGLYRCTPTGQPEQFLAGMVLAFDLAPTGDLAVAVGLGDPDQTQQTSQVRVISDPFGKKEERWAFGLEGWPAACYWDPEGERVAVLTFGGDGGGKLYAGIVGEELSVLASDVEQLYGWALMPEK